jgi:hypothetical protein
MSMTWTMQEYANRRRARRRLLGAHRCRDRRSRSRERGRACSHSPAERTSPPVFRDSRRAGRDWSRVSRAAERRTLGAADHPACNLRQMREAFAGADGIAGCR